MSVGELVICVAWKTEVMPVYAYVYYHAACYDSSEIWPDQQVSELPVSEAGHAICPYCWRVIREEGGDAHGATF